jgi:hypothetical protein
MNGALTGACNEIFRRYRGAGFSIEAAREQADQFGRRFIRIGDHAPELVRQPENSITPIRPVAIDITPRADDERDATLDRIRNVI